MLPILAHEEQFPQQPHLAANHGHQLPPPEQVALQAPLPAFVNDGRWLVQCECRSAEFAHRSDHRFFCTGCRNADVGGAWRPVQWPQRADEIERLLQVRPERRAQNWIWGMDLAILERDNINHGVPA